MSYLHLSVATYLQCNSSSGAKTQLSSKRILTSTSASDETYTPPEALNHIFPYLDKELTYYDCTSNTSMNIVNHLTDSGFKCLSSEGRDFLIDEPPECDVILTNPPYSIKDKFIHRCYDLGKPFALLMPVNTIQGIGRGNRFENEGIELLVLNKRITFLSGGTSPSFGVAWFCRNVLPEKLLFSSYQYPDKGK